MKNAKSIIFFILIIVVVSNNELYGVTSITMSDLPYLCDFENEAQMTSWTLNPISNQGDIQVNNPNRWFVGKAQACNGEQSLYVSNDDGETNSYSNYDNVLIASCKIALDQGTYDIAYDWYGYGNGKNGYVKVVFQLEQDAHCSGNYQEPNWVSRGVQLMDNNTMITNGDTSLGWQHIRSSFRVKSMMANSDQTYIFFIWVNTDAKLSAANKTISIDNVQIAKTSYNDYPSELRVLSAYSNNVNLTWSGSADSYEILYKKKMDTEFQTASTNTNSITLKNIEYGMYEIWIRGVTNGDKTVYVIFPSVVLYETDCIDALNMYDVTFETGVWNNSTGRSKQAYERVDFGYRDIRSRHTIHFDTTEIDKLTIVRDKTDGSIINGLKTVPTGHIASVRLGNWRTGAEYESIIFNYHVDNKSNGVLLINYAQVLQKVEHLEKIQPKFGIDILDTLGKSVDKTCGSVSLHSPTEEEQKDKELMQQWICSDTGAYWQGWQTIGINLEAYVGQTLSIPFTTYDCEAGGHYGYAYFTISCTRSDVDGLAWGNNNTTDHLTVPFGFKYAWFNREDKEFRDTLSTESTLYIEERDTNTYICQCTYIKLPECGFSLEASAKSYVPRAEVQLKWAPRACQNGFVIYNKCHIGLRNQITGEIEERYDKHLEVCKISYTTSSGDMIIKELDYPEEGHFCSIDNAGDTLRDITIIGGTEYNGIWYGDTNKYDVFVIPEIKPLETHLYDTICAGESLEFPNDSHVFRIETGQYYDSLISTVTGCDSTVIMNLFVHAIREEELYDTVCIGETYDFNGTALTRPGTYFDTQKSKITGCDSIISLHLAYIERPGFYIEAGTIICNEYPFLLNTQNMSTMDSLQIIIGDDYKTTLYDIHEGMDIAVETDKLKEATDYIARITCFTRYCGVIYASLPFTINLPSTSVYTFFEDVLALANEDYNGGYKFKAYQWYKNGMPIPGATYSWYYDINLDHEAQYQVLVTLEEGRQLWVCPFMFDDRRYVKTDLHSAENKNFDAPRKIIRNGTLYIIKNNSEYNLLGTKIY